MTSDLDLLIDGWIQDALPSKTAYDVKIQETRDCLRITVQIDPWPEGNRYSEHLFKWLSGKTSGQNLSVEFKGRGK